MASVAPRWGAPRRLLHGRRSTGGWAPRVRGRRSFLCADVRSILMVLLGFQRPLRITSFDAAGEFIGGLHDGSGTDVGDGGDGDDAVELEPTDVAGPCCIAGDIIAHEKMLPASRPR